MLRAQLSTGEDLTTSPVRLVADIHAPSSLGTLQYISNPLIQVASGAVDQIFTVQISDLASQRGVITVRISGDGVEISALSGLRIPVYYRMIDGILHIDWKLENLVKLRPVQFDLQLAREFVAGHQRYTNLTMFREIFLLTERSSVTFKNGETHLQLPENHRSFETRNVKTGAVPALALDQLIVSGIGRLGALLKYIAFELSGGFDSSTIVASAAQLVDEGLRTYGILFEGTPRKAQAARRDYIVTANKILDKTVDLSNLQFLASWENPQIWLNPYDEIYFRPIELGLDLAAADSELHGVVTGIGGDEAFLPMGQSDVETTNENSSVQESPFPKSACPESALLAANTRAPMFLEKNIWPINPYCFEEFIEFSERLPDSYKVSRAIQRMLLNHLGIPDMLLLRESPENFETALRRELARLTKNGPISLSRLRSHDIISSVDAQSVASMEPKNTSSGLLSLTVRALAVETCMSRTAIVH